MAKSIRNAFIRISKINNTQNGVKIYELQDIVDIVTEWQKTKRFKYYIIAHNNEPEDINPHYHLVLVFTTPTPFEQIKSKFPYGDIEPARNVKNCVQYLVHYNDLSKLQYEWSDIVTNDDNLDRYKTKSAAHMELELDDYLRRIDSGIIREYNLTEYIPIDIFSKYKPRIMNGLEFYRRRVMTNVDRDITVMFFSGETGTYKTTYAKQYCKNDNKSFCISSSNNDPMQDYKGEDVLILDDIRDTTFAFNDLLKVLDNHTNSTISSRYSNKAFIGDTIIITSSIPLSEWYFNESREDKEQLRRRIKYQFQFTKETIKMFEYDSKSHTYKLLCEVPNINLFSPEQTKQKALDILTSMGVNITEDVKQQIDNKDLNFEHLGDFESVNSDSPFVD